MSSKPGTKPVSYVQTSVEDIDKYIPIDRFLEDPKRLDSVDSVIAMCTGYTGSLQHAYYRSNVWFFLLQVDVIKTMQDVEKLLAVPALKHAVPGLTDRFHGGPIQNVALENQMTFLEAYFKMRVEVDIPTSIQTYDYLFPDDTKGNGSIDRVRMYRYRVFYPLLVEMTRGYGALVLSRKCIGILHRMQWRPVLDRCLHPSQIPPTYRTKILRKTFETTVGYTTAVTELLQDMNAGMIKSDVEFNQLVRAQEVGHWVELQQVLRH